MAPPTMAPMTVPFAVLPGAVTLEERQPGGGPRASGRERAGDGVGLRTGSKVSDECAHADSASGEGEGAASPAVAGILQSVAVRAFQRHGTGDGNGVAVGESDRHGLQAQLPAPALALELVDFSLHECAGRDDYFIAGGYGRNDLGVDVVSAVEVAGLDWLGQHKSNTGCRRER